MDAQRKNRDEPPTIALRLKPYKFAIQQLRAVLRTLKENTTVTFLPKPAMILQTVRSHHVSKITFNSSCLYITDKSFKPKTINNVVPMIGNFMYMSSSKELTKFYVKDESDLSATINMCAPDFNMDFSVGCVHGQDIVRENGDSSSRVDLEYRIVCDLLKWVAPHIKAKRNVKKSSQGVASALGGSAGGATVQILIHANPPTIKFSLGGASELEFTASGSVSFHEVKNIRLALLAKNLYQALLNCAVTKLSCTFRVLTEADMMLYVASKNTTFTVENFLTEEPFTRSECAFDGQGLNNGAQVNDGDDVAMSNAPPPVPPKKHDRSGGRKSDGDHGSSRGDKHEPNKITSYMTSKNASSERGGGYFGDTKEESDSEDSVNFEFVPNSKKQKCCQ
uniref:DNA polymerase processivity factor n=1 Tax=Cardioderma bat herpesvirus TaxID=3141914 RepID=A0AAU7E1N7_9VIRU